MGTRKSEAGKIAEGRGTGTGPDYRPWHKCREFNRCGGTASSIRDWKHGRMIETMTQGELAFYLMLRWRDDIVDIREHFPLDIRETTEIARGMGMRPVGNGLERMTTDFLVTLSDGSYAAFAVKVERNAFNGEKKRPIERLMIEYEYWKSRGIPWRVLFKEDLNPVEVRNIRDVVSCYDRSRVFDDFSLVRHMIANKMVLVDMGKEIDYKALIRELRETEEWKTLKESL